VSDVRSGTVVERPTTLRPDVEKIACSPFVNRADRIANREVKVLSRVNVLQTTPDRMADVVRVVRDVVHPGIRGEAGYVGYIVLGDRETGKALGVTLWESEAARELSDTKARQIRPRVEQETGGIMQSVERYDVLFYDVRPTRVEGPT